MIRILIFDDGYHTPTCVSENKDFFYGETELIKFLCNPHSEEYATQTIHYEYLDSTAEVKEIECFENLETKRNVEKLDNEKFYNYFNTLWNYEGDAVFAL